MDRGRSSLQEVIQVACEFVSPGFPESPLARRDHGDSAAELSFSGLSAGMVVPSVPQPANIRRTVEGLPLSTTLLAHEGGHAAIHASGEATPKTTVSPSTTGPSLLRGMAAIGLEEYRIERRLAELGYPVAENADDEILAVELFEMSAGVLNAVIDPRSADVQHFAHSVLSAVQPFIVSLAYRAGAVAAGGAAIQTDAFGSYERHVWLELVARNWSDRVQMYAKVPPIGEAWGGSAAASHLRQATEIERRLVRDLGFVVSGEATEGGRWAFRREVQDDVLTRRLELLDSECEKGLKNSRRETCR